MSLLALGTLLTSGCGLERDLWPNEGPSATTEATAEPTTLTLPTVPVTTSLPPAGESQPAVAYVDEVRARVEQSGLVGPLADCVVFLALLDHDHGVELTDSRAQELTAFCQQEIASSPATTPPLTPQP